MRPEAHYYILKDGKCLPCREATWVAWMSESKNQCACNVAKTLIGKAAFVSTIFLGIDHRFSDVGPPMLFETMIFSKLLEQHQNRYSCLDDAMQGHKQACAWVRKELKHMGVRTY